MAPSMMSLSYAVALSTLLLVETMRTTALLGNKRLTDSSINAFYEAFLDEKDLSSHPSVVVKRRENGSHSLSGQEKQYGGTFVVTHMAMIFGCAFPLWVKEVLVSNAIGSRDAGHIPGDIFTVLPSMGIIVLGVGDAVGALMGVYFGAHRWPGTKRTIEGSLGMFLSMALSVVAISYLDQNSDDDASTMRDAALVGLHSTPQLLLVTLLEAFTGQIDNLCLPIAASILCLVQRRVIE